ncbi:MAG: VWA domain-containing protein [Burkholderiales bacterium]|nr:VWA domain-containing protein [Burkholderiales bacterium]
MNVEFAEPWAFVLLPLALLPLLVRGPAINYPWLALLPRDWVSEALAWALRLAAAAAIAGAVVGLAEPYRAEVSVERIGQGAHVVLLLDRSRSMDQSFGASPGTHVLDGRRESKNSVARRLLAEFAASREQDLFGMLVFSTFPLPILDFTQKQEVIQAAIAAGGIGRGLADTDVGRGLEAALSYFEDLPYTGSRIILLVSDGGAHIDPETRQRIQNLLRRYRVALYWIYIRSFRSPGLLQGEAATAGTADSVPEHFLHRFFLGMGTPYRAYEAENPEALRRAIEDVGGLENFPIAITDVLPRRDFAGFCYVAALAFAIVLLIARFLEIRRWA